MRRLGVAIGRAADWAVRRRPRWPEIETSEHPLWVDKALNQVLPALAFLVPLMVVRWLHVGWLTATFVAAVGAFVLVFDLLLGAVRLAREFLAGYRGEPRPTSASPRRP